MNTDTTHTPAEFDARLNDLLVTHRRQEAAHDRYVTALHSVVGDVRVRGGWKMDDEEARRAAVRIIESRTSSAQLVRTTTAALKRVNDAADALAWTAADIAAIEGEYQARPWSRYVHVPNGHVHGNTWCSTLRPTTRYALRADLSGTPAASAVAQLGAILCTVCFPDAPVEWTAGKPADPNACPGTRAVEGTEEYFGRSLNGRCPECGVFQTLTMTGLLRKHKRPKG